MSVREREVGKDEKEHELESESICEKSGERGEQREFMCEKWRE